MMRGYKCGLLLLVLSFWMPSAMAEAAASGVAASAVQAAASPEDDYQAALKADAAGDMLDAGRLMHRAAQRGHAQAQLSVGLGFKSAGEDKLAAVYFRKAAEQDEPLAMLNLATMYALGEGGLKQDFAEARKWTIQAADLGSTNAISIMANAYLNGGLGLNKDAQSNADVLAWIKRAADADVIFALNVLASAYRSGQYGLAVDLQKADALEAKAKKLSGIKEKKKVKTRSGFIMKDVD